MQKRLRESDVVDSQINLRIHASTLALLKKAAKEKGYGYAKSKKHVGHCRLAREILEDFLRGGGVGVGVSGGVGV